MEKTMDVQEFQENLSQVWDEVTGAHTRYVITRGSQPLVVVLAFEDYVKMLPQDEIWARFKETWAAVGERNLQYTEEEVEAELELATRELRERRAKAP